MKDHRFRGLQHTAHPRRAEDVSRSYRYHIRKEVPRNTGLLVLHSWTRSSPGHRLLHPHPGPGGPLQLALLVADNLILSAV